MSPEEAARLLEGQRESNLTLTGPIPDVLAAEVVRLSARVEQLESALRLLRYGVDACYDADTRIKWRIEADAFLAALSDEDHYGVGIRIEGDTVTIEGRIHLPEET